MAQDKVMRVILDMQGKEKVEALNYELKQEENLLVDLSKQLRTNAISQQQFDAAVQTSAANAAHLRDELSSLKGISGMQGQGILGASYAFQDFASVMSQGGENAFPRAMMSVSNNITQVGQAAGLTITQVAALSAGFTGLTALLPILIPMFAKLWESISGGKIEFDTVTDAMDKAAKKAKELHAEVEKLKAMPAEEEETAARMAFAFKEQPGGEAGLQGRLAREMMAAGQGEPATPEQQKRIERLEQDIREADPQRVGDLPRQLVTLKQQIQASRDEATRQRAGEMIVTAKGTGPGAMRARARIGTLMPALGADMLGLTPEAMAQQEREIAEATEQGKQLHESGERRRQATAAAKKAPEYMDDAVKQFERQQKERSDEAKSMMGDAVSQFEGIDKQRKDEARAKAAKAREDAAALREAAMEEVTPAERQLNYAKRAVTFTSEQAGLGTPSTEQAERMGRQALVNFRNGMSEAQAAMGAVMSQMEEIQRASQEFQAQMGRMNGQVQSSRRRPTPTASTAGWGG